MNKEPRSFGLWDSSIDAHDIFTARPALDFPVVGDFPQWWRSSTSPSGAVTEIVSDEGPIARDIASKVHEYGGLPYDAEGNEIVWVDAGTGQIRRGRFIDGRLEDERELTNSSLRFGQPVIDGRDVIAIAENHDGNPAPADVVNTLVRITEDGGVSTVAEGSDFYTDPTVLPDGRILYCSWDHPNMPWDACALYVAEPGVTATSQHHKIEFGWVNYQPQVTGSHLYFMADPSGWLNLFRVPLDNLSASPEAVYPIEADCAQPMWNFGRRDYALGNDDIYVSVSHGGVWRVHSVAAKKIIDPEVGATALAGNGERVIGIFAGPTTFPFVGEVGSSGVVALTDVEALPGTISVPEPITFPTGDGQAHAFYYPPTSEAFVGPEGELPPLVVMVHGGPTSQAHSMLSGMTQYWTSRGFAVVDVNHRGSSGWGRDFRDQLHGNWGLVDVEDTAAAVHFLARTGRIDPARVAIRGGSAGGFTTLAALAFTDAFTAGASYYGIGDIAMLARDTHKFESRYPEKLIAPYPDPVYAERSPINHVEKISAPLILFQGLDDRVVPPNQSRSMAEAIEANGGRVELLEYEGEGHGFKITENLVDSLERERRFYLDTWGIT